jgi:hypothetical protein
MILKIALKKRVKSMLCSRWESKNIFCNGSVFFYQFAGVKMINFGRIFWVL